MNWSSETKWAKRERLSQWHRWFAWRPVRIGGRKHWFETVERKVEWRKGEDWDGYAMYFYVTKYRTVQAAE